MKKTLFFGLMVWLIPFACAFAIYPIHENNRVLFESIMPVIVAFSTVLFAVMYFRKLTDKFQKEGMLLGVIWLGISVIIDLLMFMQGPMKMSLKNYIEDIGLTYLIIPVITIGLGYIIENKMQEQK